MLFLALAMFWSVSAYAQQSSPQPLTHWSEYAVKPGKEEEFLNLVKTVGQPVRDKLMAEGVVLAWGVETSVLRGHDTATHTIWYSVADWSGIEKVESGIAAQVAKLDADAAKGAEGGKKGAKPAGNTAAILRDVVDVEKTKDYITRDLVFSSGPVPPAGTLAYVRYNFSQAKPGKGAEYRTVWEKYNKPIFDKLVADGVVLAFGFAVEEVKTTNDSTQFVWYAVKSLGDLEQVRSAATADRERRTKEERDAITAAFLALSNPEASRSEVDHALILHIAGQK